MRVLIQPGVWLDMKHPLTQEWVISAVLLRESKFRKWVGLPWVQIMYFLPGTVNGHIMWTHWDDLRLAVRPIIT